MGSQRVLVVDDHETNRLVAQETLGDDFELAFAVSGEEALEIAPRFVPDVVLLDLVLGDMDGYDVCRMLKADAKLTGAKIVIVSGRASEDERVRGYRAGAEDYLIKPFCDEELRAKVRTLAGFRSAEQENERLAGELRAIGQVERSAEEGREGAA